MPSTLRQALAVCAVTFAAVGCTREEPAPTEVAVANRAVPADAQWVTIPVSGMTCGGCEQRIAQTLGGAPGILGVEADATLGQVRVAYAKGDEQRPADARRRLADLGYPPK